MAGLIAGGAIFFITMRLAGVLVARGQPQRRTGPFQPAHTCLAGYPLLMIKWIGDFFEWFADRVPHIPRPFNQLWEALGRTDPQAPPADDGDDVTSSSS